MQKIHLKLTSKYPKYNNWHQAKHYNTIHWGVFIVFTLLIFGTILRWTPISFAADTIAPSTPTKLTATSVSSSQINLSWTASTDDVGVTGYNIYRCAGSACAPTVQIATSATNSYSNTGLIASTAYTYAVSAYDAAGNESKQSSPANAITFSSAWGATYYVAPSPLGNDVNNGTSTAPWATFTKAFSAMAGGDTLIVKDGIYTYPNVIAEIPGPPSGTANQYTIIKAENDGGAIIDAKYSEQAIRIYQKSFIQIEGFKAINGYGYVVYIDTSDHIKVLRTGAANSMGSYDAVFSIGRSSYCLIEDSWAWGINEALLTIYESDHNIVRRFVGRTDTIENLMIGERGIRFYSSPNNLMQNVIAIDFNPNIPAESYGNFAMSNVKNLSYNNEWLGNIILNVGQYGGFMIAEMGAGGNSFKNSIIWGIKSGIITKGGNSSSIIDQNTVGLITGAGSNSDNSGDVIKNNIFLNNTTSNGGAPAFYNVYFNSGVPQGANYSTNNPNLQYILRTTDTGTGENGVKRGATIEKRHGASGTLWGEPGYNQLTNENLWPWPNEARIRNDMRAVMAYPSTVNSSIAVDTTRGFAADGMSLTKYIWEYLGNPCPSEICSGTPPPPPPSDTIAPTIPANLISTPISSSQIDLSWTASTDNVGVTGYRVERCQGFSCTNFAQIAAPTGTTYSDIGLSASTIYQYRVRATDVAGNLSEYSATANATTQAAPPPFSSCTPANILCVDDTPGSMQEYSTIQAAADVAKPGDTVLVFDGVYAGFQVTTSGISTASLTFKTQGTGTLINTGSITGDGIRLQNVSYITVEGFNIQNTPQRCIAARGATATSPMTNLTIRNNTCSQAGVEGFYLSQVSNSLVENNTIRDSGVSGAIASHGIYLANGGSDNTVIRGNNISNSKGAGSEGIHVNGDISIGGDGIVSGLTIEKNTIFNNATNGINFDGVQDSLIQNNLVYGNGRHALRAYQIDGAQGPKNLKIINNTFHTTSTGGWAIKISEDLGGHTIFNNILMSDNLSTGSISVNNLNFTSNYNAVVDRLSFNNETTIVTLASWKASGYDTNSLISLPVNLFTNPSTASYTLKAGSPAIDKGIALFNTVSAPENDIINTSRPQGVAYDLGAYEVSIGSDTIPPSTPTNPTATTISSSQINLLWTASTDDVGVAGYKIYRDGSLLTTQNSSLTTYFDTGLTASTAYTYAVSAYDAAGNESAKSSSISATTLAGFKPSDLNQDTKVDSLDFEIFKLDFNRTDKPKSDLNQDGIVDTRDLGIMMSSWEN